MAYARGRGRSRPASGRSQFAGSVRRRHPVRPVPGEGLARAGIAPKRARGWPGPPRTQTAKGETKPGARRRRRVSEAEPGLAGGWRRAGGGPGAGRARPASRRGEPSCAHLRGGDRVPVTAGGRRRAPAPGHPDVAAPLPSVPDAHRAVPPILAGPRAPLRGLFCALPPAGSGPVSGRC